MSWVNLAVTGINAYSQVQNGRFANAQAGLSAQAAEYQAKVENENALKMAEMIRRAGRRQVGQTVAGYAKAGVAVGEGSALEAERQINLDVEHDAFQALLDGSRRASGLQVEATMERANGRMRQAAGYVQAAGTVLGGTHAAMRANGWYSRRTDGGAPVETRTPVPTGPVGRNW
jgi:hypothetical protein